MPPDPFDLLSDYLANVDNPGDPDVPQWPEAAELDEWRASYGRLDIPATVIDWRPIYAGAAALGIALVARWVVRDRRSA